MAINAQIRIKPVRENVKKQLMRAFYVRIHAFLLLVWCGGFAYGGSKLLRFLGVEHMGIRYGLAVLIGYGAFLIGVRIWLHYVGFGEHLKSEDSSTARSNFSDAGEDVLSAAADGAEIALRAGSRSSGSVTSSGEFISGDGTGGGQFFSGEGIGGEAFSSSGGGGSGGSLDIGDCDEAAIPIFVIFLIGVVLLSVFVGGIYLGAELFVELAFEMFLAMYIQKGVRKNGLPWLAAAFKNTWIALLIVMAVTVGGGTWIQKTYGTHSAYETVEVIKKNATAAKASAVWQ